MTRLTEASLRQFAEEYRADLGGSPDLWVYVMALGTFASLFGTDDSGNLVGPRWVFANVRGYGDGLPDDYLRDDWAAGTKRRMVDLAEMLYHFQDVEGIDRLLETLRTDSIESAFAELEAAKLLHIAGLPFRFVEPRGVKGADFDAEVIAADGGTINCEMKCKLESTDLTDQTIVDTLKKSAEQLPREEANLIFVKVPEHWVRQPEIEETVRRAVRRFFGQSRRVAAVVFHWQETIPVGDGPIIIAMKHRHELNDNAVFKDFVKSELIDHLPRITLPALASNTASDPGHKWRHFDRIAREMAGWSSH